MKWIPWTAQDLLKSAFAALVTVDLCLLMQHLAKLTTSVKMDYFSRHKELLPLLLPQELC